MSLASWSWEATCPTSGQQCEFSSSSQTLWLWSLQAEQDGLITEHPSLLVARLSLVAIQTLVCQNSFRETLSTSQTYENHNRGWDPWDFLLHCTVFKSETCEEGWSSRSSFHWLFYVLWLAGLRVSWLLCRWLLDDRVIDCSAKLSGKWDCVSQCLNFQISRAEVAAFRMLGERHLDMTDTWPLIQVGPEPYWEVPCLS